MMPEKVPNVSVPFPVATPVNRFTVTGPGALA
jgi:hypothetical protein